MDLITGATGFIGGHLTRRLCDDGRAVRVLCRPASVARLDPGIARRCEIVFGDLRDSGSLEQAIQGVERVFHCAGHVLDWGTEADFRGANVAGTGWLLQAALRARVKRFVHLSSIAVLGVPSPATFDDESPYRPGRDLYSRTKIEGEKLVLRFHAEQGLPVTILRPSVVYGLRGTWIEEPIQMILKDRMFLLGGGAGTCHPCYIENLLDGMILVAEHPGAVGQAYLIGDDDPITFREYFDSLAEIVGKAPIRRSIPLPIARLMASGFEAAHRLTRASSRPLLTHAAIDMVCTSSRMSIRKIREELGYAPRYRMSQAMAELRPHYAGRHPEQAAS